MALGLWLMEPPLTYPDPSHCYSALSPLLQRHQCLCFPSNPNVLFSGAPGPLCFLLPQPEVTPPPPRVGFLTVLCANVLSSPRLYKTAPTQCCFSPFWENFKLFPHSTCHSLQVCPKCYFFLRASVGLLGLGLAQERNFIQFSSFPAQIRL